VFVVSMIRGAKAGAVLAYRQMNEHTLNVVIDAIKILIERDRESGK
jgi:uridine phosphorylase